MRTPLVEIRDVLGQHSTKAVFAEDESVIQKLLPDRSHPSPCDRIGLWRSEWGKKLKNIKPL